MLHPSIWCLTPFFWLALAAHAATSELEVELPQELRRMAGGGTASTVTHALVTIAIPDALAADVGAPVLVVSATSEAGHRSSRKLLGAYSKAGLERGWVLVAADPGEPLARDRDTSQLRLALNNAALAALRKVRPAAANAPLAFAGFSGGAKYSGWLAAAFARQGRKVIGLYQAGINEDTLSEAARHFDILDAHFRRTPVFLQSGAKDPVATPEDHRKVAASLARSGFGHVRIETSPGGHEVDAWSLREALEWFVGFTTPALPAPR